MTKAINTKANRIREERVVTPRMIIELTHNEKR